MTQIRSIGNDVWIGCNSVIFKGVNIGDGSIIAAGLVLQRMFPHIQWRGVSVKVIQKRFSDNIVE